MIVAEDKATISGDLQFDEQVQMQLDPAAIAMHIRNMIRMYANPRLAALREYTSNARDSHKAAGYKGPVEVTLPTSLHPFLTIRDYGIGLNRDEVKGFGQFGRSTKADSNEYIGGFGLGSKSGLAVATQFTVIAVQGGKKNVVVVGRDEKNNPSLGFMAEQDTSERNGVTIQIPAEKGHSEWIDIAAGNTFIGWERGSILINGKEPVFSVHDTNQYTRLDGGWLSLAPRSGSGYRHYNQPPVDALVHGVYYSIPSERLGNSHSLILRGSVIEIDNGSVDILPSRDDLEWTDRTAKAVNAAATRLTAAVLAEYQRKIVEVKTFREAKAVAEAMDSIGLPTSDLHHKGIRLDWTGRANTARSITVGAAKSSSTAKSGWQADRTAITTSSTGDAHRKQSVLVYGCAGESHAGYYRKDHKYIVESVDSAAFAIAEAKRAGVQVNDVVVYFWNQPDTNTLPGGFVAAQARVIDAATFTAEAAVTRAEWAANRATPGTGRAKAVKGNRVLRVVTGFSTYSYTFNTTERDENTITALGHKIVVVRDSDTAGAVIMGYHRNGANTHTARNAMAHIGNAASTVQFILLPSNHKAENLSLTGWVELSDWVKAELRSLPIHTPEQIAAADYKRGQSYGRTLPALSAEQIAKIANPQMRVWMEGYSNPIGRTTLNDLADTFPKYAPHQPQAATFKPGKVYPLLDALNLSAHRAGDLIDYINLVTPR